MDEQSKGPNLEFLDESRESAPATEEEQRVAESAQAHGLASERLTAWWENGPLASLGYSPQQAAIVRAGLTDLKLEQGFESPLTFAAHNQQSPFPYIHRHMGNAGYTGNFEQNRSGEFHFTARNKPPGTLQAWVNIMRLANTKSDPNLPFPEDPGLLLEAWGLRGNQIAEPDTIVPRLFEGRAMPANFLTALIPQGVRQAANVLTYDSWWLDDNKNALVVILSSPATSRQIPYVLQRLYLSHDDFTVFARKANFGKDQGPPIPTRQQQPMQTGRLALQT